MGESETYIDVDTPDLFPEECLIHEDCPQDSFCSPQPDNTWVSRQSLYFEKSGGNCVQLSGDGRGNGSRKNGPQQPVVKNVKNITCMYQMIQINVKKLNFIEHVYI